ncbi:MAG TPA: efflux RND transporter periplasmic adaptor subunit [Pyrinomonadaceae bacterium]|nr:efflux RND transporter periplasmic adaptor subunit [Pyrinomonadaceae bacterium]
MALSRKKKIIIGSSVGVLLVIVIVASIFATRTDTPEVTAVKIEVRPELKSTVTSSGEVRPIQFMNLTSEVEGKIEDITVKEGDVVDKGQVLVRLDPNQLESSADAQFAAFQSAQTQITGAENQRAQANQQLNVAQIAVDTARQNVSTSQTEIDRAQVDLNAAIRELKRNEKLLESGVVSRKEYDEAKDRVDATTAALKTSRERLETAKISVRDAQARVRQQEVAVRDAANAIDRATKTADQQAAVLRGQRDRRDKTTVIAPIAGVIAEIPSKVGTFAVAGLSTTALLTIADMSQVNVEVKVDETEIDKVAVGQKAKIKVDAFGEKELEGEVLQKTPLAVGKSQTGGGLSVNINVQEAKEFRVVVRLVNLTPEMQSGLRPGMSATATITTTTANDVIAVPLQAVIEKKPEGTPSPEGQPPAAGAAPVDKPKPIKGVYVMEDGKAKFVEVETGITGESDIQILKGLSAGQEVITGPSRILNTLKEGTVVKRQEKKEGENANKS